MIFIISHQIVIWDSCDSDRNKDLLDRHGTLPFSDDPKTLNVPRTVTLRKGKC